MSTLTPGYRLIHSAGCDDIEQAGICSHRSPPPVQPEHPGHEFASHSHITGRPPHILAAGHASGQLLFSKVPLSFWGGTDPKTGTIVDTHHDLVGESFAGRILALPSARGSCSGSLAILECIMSGKGPIGVVLAEPDHILALGALVAGVLFGKAIPVVVIGERRYGRLRNDAEVRIDGTTSSLTVKNPDKSVLYIRLEALGQEPVELSKTDKEILRGVQGEGTKKAMELVVAMAKMYGATQLIDVSHAHIDACIYVGPATLLFAQHFERLHACFAVPTTLNAVSVDQRRWREFGVAEEEAIEACKLADAYIAMGASAQSFTCAPYLLPNGPERGNQIVWAESNAVVYANSVLGAKTLKYPDMLDVVVALTGRAPLSGCHTEQQRRATLRIDVDSRLSTGTDDSFWPLLGYRVGAEAGNEVVMICGLELSSPTADDLKAFGAAYATSSGSPMFHIRGITPEALTWSEEDEEGIRRHANLTLGDLAASWKELNSATNESVGLVAIGNPHASIVEIEAISEMVKGRKLSSGTKLIITCGRWTADEAGKRGYTRTIRDFGGDILTDTCWCMIDKPIVPEDIENVMTNSAKYAHYGPGRTGKGAHFGGMADCIEAGIRGRNVKSMCPTWLLG